MAELDKNLQVVEFFKKSDNNAKEFLNGYCVTSPKGTIVYLFSKGDCGYISYSLPEFAKKAMDEGIEFRQGVRGELNEIRKSFTR